MAEYRHCMPIPHRTGPQHGLHLQRAPAPNAQDQPGLYSSTHSIFCKLWNEAIYPPLCPHIKDAALEMPETFHYGTNLVTMASKGLAPTSIWGKVRNMICSPNAVFPASLLHHLIHGPFSTGCTYCYSEKHCWPGCNCWAGGKNHVAGQEKPTYSCSVCW